MFHPISQPIDLTMLSRNLPRLSTIGLRHYAKPPKGKVSQFIDDIGNENTKTAQNTLKTVRWMGAITIIGVCCSLFWVSSMTAPVKVKEVEVDVGDLSKDIRHEKD